MIKPQLFTAYLENKIEHNPNYFEFHFELKNPPRLENLAGQHIIIDVPQSDGQIIKRAYSMCDRPDIDHGFELIIAQRNGGVGVNYLNTLQFGDEISLLGPLGLFTISPQVEQEKQLCFVATGAGIAPIKSMLTDLLQNQRDQRPMTLYWGMRHENDFFWLEDLLDWQKSFPNFRFVPVLSQPSDGWTLSRGHVSDCLLVDGVQPETGCYICGSAVMIEETVNLLNQKFDLPLSLLHREQF